ncbi:EAL domain-containing protein [Zhongshania borealis]|uniref:EAL domain-containing protein n=1 Tax=Zhongshania borealis TaxID=889488 RepID=A0ABP7WII9_9GAMM
MPNTSSPSSVNLGLQRKLSVVLFLAVAIVMGGRGYLSYIQTIQSQHQAVLSKLDLLENTLTALIERSSKELFRLADQQTVPSEAEIIDNNIRPPSLLSGIESTYYLNKDGTILASSVQDSASVRPSRNQLTAAAQSLSRKQRPIATLNCVQQCFQSVYIPIITDDGRELIININRSATLLIQDFYEITGADIALLAMNQQGGAFSPDRIIAASHAEKMSIVLADILKSVDFTKEDKHDFFELTNHGLYSARFYRLSQNDDDVVSYAAVIEDQSQIQAQQTQALKDVVFSTLITLFLIIVLISFILKPSLDRLMKLSKILPLLPEGHFQKAQSLLQKQLSTKKYTDEIDVLQSTVGDVILSLERMNSSVDQHRNELKTKIEALTEAKVFNELILDASPLVVIIHDSAGAIRNINKMGRELTGLDIKAPINANINTWVRNETQSKSLSASLQSITDTTGKKSQGQMPFYTDDGRKLYFLWTHTCLHVNEVAHILSMGIDITERKEAAESLHWLGQHDRITGLLNRSSFTENANEFITKHRDKDQIELVMFDIDDFAIFNDRFGFDAGDRLLNDLAAHLMRELPESSLLARTGSGEFCAIIHHTLSSKQGVRDLGLEKLTRFSFSKGDIKEEICLSIVVDSYDDSLSGVDELISNTTSTMIKVKSKSRGNLYYAAESDDTSRVTRHEKYRMKEQLQSALSGNRLVLFYQPILDLNLNSISHCECLVRMLDDEGQFISPAHFLGIAAESGLMPRLDFSVMEKAMRQQRMWQDSGIHTGLSINITAPTLEQPDFEERLNEILQRTGANPDRLIFEVVETDALENLSTARKLLNNFKAVGAKVAFDDFGIGFTSFEYVRELPVDYIKIDQSFIRFIHERESDQVLVKSMVEMSHNLGKKVIVEGVENRAALEIVRDMGVEYVQGYYVCRPMPISALDLSLRIHDF